MAGPCTCGFHIWELPQTWINIWKKEIPGSFKKQNVYLLHVGNYLHGVYIVLGILSDLEII